MAFQYLTFFLEDDAKLEEIRREYGAGRMTTFDVKQTLVEVLQLIVKNHQVRRFRIVVRIKASLSRACDTATSQQ